MNKRCVGWIPVWLVGCVIVAALLGLLPRIAAAELQLYRPAHRPAEELAALAEPLLAPEGTALADPQTGAVLLRGEPAALARALELLRSLDVAPTQYRVESEIVAEDALRDRGVAVGGWISVGDLRVGRIPGPRDGDGVVVGVRAYRTEDEESFRGFMVVLEGQPADLWTGASYPVEVRQFEFGSGRERVLETTPLIPVESGFRVIPRSLPDGMIELEITSVLARRRDGGEIAETGVSTRVRVRSGEKLAIASTQQIDRGTGSGLIGAESQATSESRVVLVSATALDLAGEPQLPTRR